MGIIILLVGILLAAFAVLGWLFYSVRREAAAAVRAVPAETAPAVVAPLPRASDAPVRTEVPAVEARTVPEVSAPAAAIAVVPAVVPEVRDVPAAQDNDEITRLRLELRSIREKAVVQARGALETITTLRQENERLRAVVKSGVPESPRAGETDALTHLRAENAAYRSQIAELRDGAEALTRSMEAMRQDFDGKLAQAKYAIDDMRDAGAPSRVDELVREVAALRQDNETLRAAQALSAEKTDAAVSVGTDAVASLRSELDAARFDRARLEARLVELEEAARREQEQNQDLQYELTKSRAQGAGVERMYSNVRQQFETMSREVRLTEHNNESLRRQADIIEKSLADFRQLNGELLKNEKLTQFELDRNRSQLRDLERICDGFRSRLQMAGVDIKEQA